MTIPELPSPPAAMLRFLYRGAMIVTLATASAAALPANPRELPKDERHALLQRLKELKTSNPALEADFREERSLAMLRKPVVTEGRVWFEAPDKFRREVNGTNPSLTVTNGAKLWIFYPNFKEAELYTLGEGGLLDSAVGALIAGLNFDRIEDYYGIAAYKTDGGYQLRLTPRRPSLKRIMKTLSINLDDTLRVRRTDFESPKGDQVMTLYTNHRTRRIPTSVFDFDPPAGTNVTKPLGGK